MTLRLRTKHRAWPTVRKFAPVPFFIGTTLVCTVDPYWSCNVADNPRTVLRLHADDTPTDPLWASDSLILPFDNGVAVDYSPAARVMVPFGDAAVTATRSKWGTTSYENTGSNPATSYRGSLANFNFAATDHLCLDAWIYATAPANGNYQGILLVGTPGVAGAYVILALNPTGHIGTTSNLAGSGFFSTNPLPANQWVKVAWQLLYTGTNPQVASLYMDENTQLGSAGGLLGALSNGQVWVGSHGGAGGCFMGSIADARIGKNVRFELSQNNTIPPFANPRALTPLAIDCSCARPKTAAFSGFATAGPPPLMFSRFSGRAFYVPTLLSTNNMDNGIVVSDDTDFDNGTADFGWRLWAIRLNNTRAGILISFSETGGAFQVQVSTAGLIQIDYRSSGGLQSVPTGVAWPLNVLQHFALQRRGANWESFLHGVRIDQRAIAGGAASTVNSAGPFYVGRGPTLANTSWNGWFDEIDALKGAAFYPGATYTVPDLPNCCGPVDPELPIVGPVPMLIDFHDSSTNDPITWDWNFGDGSAHASVASPSHTYTVPGTYDVTLTVTNLGGDAHKKRAGYVVAQ